MARTLRRRGAGGKRLPPLLFFTDPVRTPDPERIVAMLPRGSAVVFRAFGSASREAQGAAVARAARQRGVCFLVGADAGLAVRLRADGLHLPERMARKAGTVRRLGRRFLITAACHSLPAALRARRGGADAIVVSVVFASQSHAAVRPMGVRAFAVIARRSRAAAYALGGVNAATARRLRGSGAIGIAAIGAFAD